MHVIINLGEDVCKNGLKDLDKVALTEESYFSCHQRGESTTHSAIYLAYRLFHRQGLDKFGKSAAFESYLKEDEEALGIGLQQAAAGSKAGTQVLAQRSKLQKEVGNRAHVTMSNGATLWFHGEHIIKYITGVKAEEIANEAVKAMEVYIEQKVPMAGARALGILKYSLTGPFQHAFDRECSNILDMVPCCITLKAALEEMQDDALVMLRNPQSAFPTIPMQEDTVKEALFEETNDPVLDSLTIMALQLIIKY